MLLALNSMPIVIWNTDLTPYEIMFNRNPRIIECPTQEEYENLADFLQEKVKTMATAQDLVRKQCKRTYNTQLPGNHFREPKALKPGQWVLTRRDLIMTNMHSAKNKLLRAYTGPFQITVREGNHYSIDINGATAVYHRRRLKKITYKEEGKEKGETEGEEE